MNNGYEWLELNAEKECVVANDLQVDQFYLVPGNITYTHMYVYRENLKNLPGYNPVPFFSVLLMGIKNGEIVFKSDQVYKDDKHSLFVQLIISENERRHSFNEEDYSMFYVHLLRIANLSRLWFYVRNDKGVVVREDSIVINGHSVYWHLCNHTSLWYHTDKKGFDTPLCDANVKAPKEAICEELKRYFSRENVLLVEVTKFD